MNKSKGSGVTTREMMTMLRKELISQHRAHLEAMGRGFSKKCREDMQAGFSDGMTSLLVSLERMHIVTVYDDDKSANAASKGES
jgi:hypothetical protein